MVNPSPTEKRGELHEGKKEGYEYRESVAAQNTSADDTFIGLKNNDIKFRVTLCYFLFVLFVFKV